MKLEDSQSVAAILKLRLQVILELHSTNESQQDEDLGRNPPSHFFDSRMGW